MKFGLLAGLVVLAVLFLNAFGNEKSATTSSDVFVLENLGQAADPHTGAAATRFRSKELGVEFLSLQLDVVFKKGPDGTLEGYIPTDAKTCQSMKSCLTLKGKYYSNILSGTINILTKPADQTPEQAVLGIINSEGKNPDDCIIVQGGFENYPMAQKGQIISEIVLAKPYKPSQNEILQAAHLTQCGKTPECEWAREGLLQQKTNALCGKHAASFRYKGASDFIFEPEASKTRFLYLATPGGSADFYNWGSFKILPD